MALEKPENPLLYIGHYLLKGGSADEAPIEAEPEEIAIVEPERPPSVVEEKPPTPPPAAAPVKEASAEKPKKKIGDIICAPVSMKFTELSRMGFEPSQSYTLHWSLDNDCARNSETWDGELNKQNAYQWADQAEIPVMDKSEDKIVTVILTKSGSKFAGETICEGKIPQKIIDAVYDLPNLKQKSQLIDMFNPEGDRCASFRVKVSFRTGN